MVNFFGDRWDAPFFDAPDVRQLATPVGEECIWCREKIVMGDQGIVTPYICCTIEPEYEPIHRECLARTMTGSYAHVSGQCPCKGVDAQKYPGSKHEEALAVQAIVDENQGFDVYHFQTCEREKD